MEEFLFGFLLLAVVAVTTRAAADSSCAGRCQADLDSSRTCQCNTTCDTHKDCCTDHHHLCTGGAIASSTSCQNLSQISQELWDNDLNRLSSSDVTVNFQTQVPDYSKQDSSSERLFTYVNEVKLTGSTYSTFLALLDNFDHDKGDLESLSPQEQEEQEMFLNAILATQVMNSLLKYLTCKGIVISQDQLKDKLKKIWMDFYPRSGNSMIPDTSGFEHVMAGEYKSNTVVNGFHNWLSFYQKEKAGEVNYYGYVERAENILVGAAFNWNNRIKAIGSFFLNVSPEFDIAIYTLCYLTNVNRNCNIVLNGLPITIMSYDKNGHLATAFASAA